MDCRGLVVKSRSGFMTLCYTHEILVYQLNTNLHIGCCWFSGWKEGVKALAIFNADLCMVYMRHHWRWYIMYNIQTTKMLAHSCNKALIQAYVLLNPGSRTHTSSLKDGFHVSDQIFDCEATHSGIAVGLWLCGKPCTYFKLCLHVIMRMSIFIFLSQQHKKSVSRSTGVQLKACTCRGQRNSWKQHMVYNIHTESVVPAKSSMHSVPGCCRRPIENLSKKQHPPSFIHSRQSFSTNDPYMHDF